MLGKIEVKRRRGQQKMKWLDNIIDSVDLNLSTLWKTVEEQGSLACCSSWSHRVGHNLATKQDLVWNVGSGHRNEKKRRDLPLQLVELWSPKKCMNLCCFCVLSLSVCLLAPNVVMEIHGKMRQLEAQIFSWITTQGSPREEETHREMAERESLKIATPKCCLWTSSFTQAVHVWI